MKNLKQKLIDIFFNVDFTNSIVDGFKDYGLLYREIPNKGEVPNNLNNTNSKELGLSNQLLNLNNSDDSKKINE
jgi:hypothetical protein